MSDYGQLAPKERLTQTQAALEKRGITSEVVPNKQAAQEKVLSLIPNEAEIMTMTSITLEQTGLTDILNESGKYTSVKQKLSHMNRETESRQMQQLGAAPEWAIGSVHAITQDGQVIIASNTGSQLPAYVYGAAHVIWVVGTQKIVSNFEAALGRIDEYIVPRETQRARQAYGLPDTFETYPSKVLVVNRETQKGRIHIVFVEEALGF